jgi:hypothetical protein
MPIPSIGSDKAIVPNVSRADALCCSSERVTTGVSTETAMAISPPTVQ